MWSGSECWGAVWYVMLRRVKDSMARLGRFRLGKVRLGEFRLFQVGLGKGSMVMCGAMLLGLIS